MGGAADIEGWLKRRNDSNSWIWHRRYFFLEGNRLLWFKKAGDPVPRGQYILSPHCSVGEVFDSTIKHKHHDQVWMFRLSFSSLQSYSHGSKGKRVQRFIDLGAATEENATEWRTLIFKAIKASQHMKSEQQLGIRNLGCIPANLEPILKDDTYISTNLQRRSGSRGTSGRGSDVFSPVGAETSGSTSPFASEIGKKIPQPVKGSFQSPLDSDITQRDDESLDGDVWRVISVDAGVRVMRKDTREGKSVERVVVEEAAHDNYISFLSTASGVLLATVSSIYLSLGFALLLGVLSGILVLLYCQSKRATGEAAHVPVLKVSEIVRGTPASVCKLIIDRDQWSCWSGEVISSSVLEVIDSHTRIIHIVYRPVWLWPLWHRARDVVCMEYWRQEEDGTFLVLLQSVQHPSCPPVSNYVRAIILGASYVISPRTPENARHGPAMVRVTFTLRYDPGGYATLWNAFQRDTHLRLPLMRSVIGIREEMARDDFIEPKVTMMREGSDEFALETEGEGSSASNRRGITAVDHQGLVQGVKRYPSTIPEKYWAEPDGSRFLVRGPTYLIDKVKKHAGPSAFHLVAVDGFAFENPSDRFDIASHPENFVQKLNREDPNAPFTLVVHYGIPSKENWSVVTYFHPRNPHLLEDKSVFAELVSDFFDGGDDTFRDSRIKIIPNVVEGNFLLKKAARPAKMGPVCQYFRGKNYFEIDVSIDNDPLAHQIVSMAVGIAKHIVVDIAIVIEALAEEELPEVVLAGFRLANIDPYAFDVKKITTRSQRVEESSLGERESESMSPALPPNNNTSV